MRIKKIRLSQNLSVPELSRRSGVPIRTIERTEKSNSCTVGTAKKLAKALQVTLDELCQDDLDTEKDTLDTK